MSSVKSTMPLQRSPRVRLSLPCGPNAKGSDVRTYVQQIVSSNEHRIPSETGNVYDWVVQNAGKPSKEVIAPDKVRVTIPAANFAKLGRTAADETGLYRIKFELGDGVYRIVRPDVDDRSEPDSTGRRHFRSYPQTVFAKVSGGQMVTLSENEARAQFKLAAKAETGRKRASYLDDDDDDVSI